MCIVNYYFLSVTKIDVEGMPLVQFHIEPWEHLIDTVPPGTILEQYVPPEVEEAARHVMTKYDMQVSSMVLITSKPDKGGAIWRIETNHGPRSLKVLHRTPARSLFSIGAQQYLVEQGARVPALIQTIENDIYVETGGKLWIVTDWIEPMQPVSKVDLEGAALLCYGLGEFHKFSKGYIPPSSAGKSSRLYTWPAYYEKIIAKIGWFRDIAAVYTEFPVSQKLLEVVDSFETQAKETLDRLLNVSKYFKMVAMGEPYWGLVHQDYGWSNGQMGPGGIWVIDLDGVAYDLPFRDLRKLITSTMDDMGYWDITWIRGMIGAYHEANPMDRETFELLCLDMAFPNEFYKHVKEIVFDPTTFMSMELEGILQRVLATESTKWQALNELAGDIENYEPGDYSQVPESSMWQFTMPSIEYANGELVFDKLPPLHPDGELATDAISTLLPNTVGQFENEASSLLPAVAIDAAVPQDAPTQQLDTEETAVAASANEVPPLFPTLIRTPGAIYASRRRTIRRKRRRTRRHRSRRVLTRRRLAIRRKRRQKFYILRRIKKTKLSRTIAGRKKRISRSAAIRKSRKKSRSGKTG